MAHFPQIQIIDYMDLIRGPRPSKEDQAKTVRFIREWTKKCHDCGHGKVNHTSGSNDDAACFYEEVEGEVCGCTKYMLGPAPTQWERLLGTF